MFNLEEKISEWRKQMLAAGIQSPVPLEELENHLRDELERQIKIGVTAQTGYAIAVKKVGQGSTLQNEFKKAEPPKTIRNWKFFEICFLASILLIPLVVVGQAFYFKDGGFAEMTTRQQMSSVAAAVTLSLLAWIMRLGCEKFPSILTNQIRDAILVPVVFGVLTLACFIVPRFNFIEDERAVVSLWAFAPFGLLIGWAWGFATTARKKIMAGS